MASQEMSRQSSQRLLELALARNLITAEDVTSLSGEGDLCDRAVERQLLSASDVELLRPLAESETFLPDYKILELLGDGAAGTVYKARQLKLDRIVALKLLKSGVLENAKASARSQIEAQVGASLQHPNIVTVHDYGVHRQRVYLAFEHIDGESILERIERTGPLDSTLALHLIRQAVTALDYANQQGVVHRDVKPANLLLTAKTSGLSLPTGIPAVKVSDFGLAIRHAEQSSPDDATRLTATGATLGTPSYVAPEQLEDTSVDQRADIYGLGATLFHMVSGKQPFSGANAFQAIADKMSGKQTWRETLPDSIPVSVRQLITAMTHHNPSDRFQSFGDLSDRLETVLARGVDVVDSDLADADLAGSAVPAATDSHRRINSNRTWWSIGAIAAIGFAALVVASTNLLSQRQPVAVAVARIKQIPLFFGDSIPRGQQTGIWKIAEDLEGGAVLEGGNGSKTLALEFRSGTSEFYTFQIGVNPLDDATADVCFAVNQSGHCTIVRLGAGEATFGQGHLEHTDFMADTSFKPQQMRTAENGPVYQIVNVERQSSGWFVNVNGQRIGTVISESDQLPQVVLRATGIVQFENITLTQNEATQLDG